VEIFLPDRFNRITMYQLISEIICENNQPKYNDIVFNFERLRFIKPSGITILNNIIQWLQKNKTSVNFNIPEMPKTVNQKTAIKYLDDTGFFSIYLNKNIFFNSKLRETTIPLKNITCDESFSWLETTLITWLMGILKVDNRAGFSGIKTCIGEIFNNIRDHSGENIGCAFAQYYPKDKEIQIAISDFGVGIPFQIKKRYKCQNDAQALSIAIKEGTTTQSYPGNRGAGLDHLIKIIVENNQGSIYIYSDHGILSCYFEQGLSIKSELSKGFYPGTLILIKLRTNNIYEEPYEEDFSW